MTTYRFTAREKLQEVEREIEQRRYVYGRKVDRGEWTQSKADKHIEVMKAIAIDYRAQLEADDLFAPVMVRVPLEPTAEQYEGIGRAIGAVFPRAAWARLLAVFGKQ